MEENVVALLAHKTDEGMECEKGQQFLILGLLFLSNRKSRCSFFLSLKEKRRRKEERQKKEHRLFLFESSFFFFFFLSYYFHFSEVDGKGEVAKCLSLVDPTHQGNLPTQCLAVCVGGVGVGVGVGVGFGVVVGVGVGVSIGGVSGGRCC